MKFVLIKLVCFFVVLSINTTNAYAMGIVEKLFGKQCSSTIKCFVDRGKKDFLRRPFLEISGMSIPCQQKAIVLSCLTKQLQNQNVSQELEQTAAIIECIQPKLGESHVSDKTVRENIKLLCGKDCSKREVQDFKKYALEHANNFVDSSFKKMKEKFPKNNCDADIFCEVIKKESLSVVAAVYLGSPTLDEVMQHNFQYVFEGTYDEEKGRIYFDPNVDDSGARGRIPKTGGPKVIVHMGIPNALYNSLSSGKFYHAHPHHRNKPETCFSKLNLSDVALRQVMKSSFKEMAHMRERDHELGLKRGQFRYPFSLYHFSCSPCWPTGEQEIFLGKRLHEHNGIELKSDLHRESYFNKEFSPLEIYPIYPNRFLGPIAPYPGYDFIITKKGYRIRLRLVAGKETVFQKTDPMMKDEQFNYSENDFTSWHWDTSRSGFFVQKFDQQKFKNCTTLSPQEIQYFFALICKAMRSHFELNFCFKTRFLLMDAGLSLDSFDSGILNLKNAEIFYNNGKKPFRKINE